MEADTLRPEVKQIGKVTVLRFSRREFTPERQPSPKRFLRKIRAALVPCQAPEISADQLEKLILDTFGRDYQYHVLISDEKFRIITKDKVAELLAKDDTDKLPYIATYADCDDFSDVLLGSLTRMTWSQGFALGQLWYINPDKGFGHACNLFCDGQKIWLVEPQNDRILEWGSDENYKGYAYMVKF
jgi:hypothetical protein